MRHELVMFGFLLMTACAASTAQPPPEAPAEHRHQSSAASEHAHGAHGKGHGAHGKGGAAPAHEMQCPMQLPGTSVSAVELDGAAGLEFQTQGDPAELQRRVTQMAAKHADGKCAMHSQPGHAPAGAEGHAHAGAGGHAHAASEGANGSPATGCEHCVMHSATVEAELTTNGARLVFRPRDAADLPALRAALQAKAERMNSGKCEMHGGKHAHTAPTQG